ncbi:phage tail protein [Croceibacterium xixiisoli]
MHLMALGMFLFELATLSAEELQRKTNWSHARSPRIGARDATQYTGPGEEVITLAGSVFQEIADGRVSLDQLRELADAGEALPLVAGNGTVFGCFVIEGLDERHTWLLADGTPRQIDFSINLLRVDDPATQRYANGDQPAPAKPAA